MVAGDEVTFTWSVPPEVTGAKIGLYTTDGPLAKNYDESGFRVDASPSGISSRKKKTIFPLFGAIGKTN